MVDLIGFAIFFNGMVFCVSLLSLRRVLVSFGVWRRLPGLYLLPSEDLQRQPGSDLIEQKQDRNAYCYSHQHRR